MKIHHCLSESRIKSRGLPTDLGYLGQQWNEEGYSKDNAVRERRRGKQNHLSGVGPRLELSESAQPARCEITGEGSLQESVSRVTRRGISLFDYFSRIVTPRAARGTGLVLRRTKFCRVAERSSSCGGSGTRMAGHMTSVMTQDIEDAVHRFVLQRRRLTFTMLSHAFPQSTWQTLFQVLHHLQEKDLVVLIPLLWDYEICAQEEIVRTDEGTT